MAGPVIRFEPGKRINPKEILEIIGLSATSSHWAEIGRVYPEVATAGPKALFRGQRNVTIYPPSMVSARQLKRLVASNDRDNVYPSYHAGKLVSVLIHVKGGYASLHIYRLR